MKYVIALAVILSAGLARAQSTQGPDGTPYPKDAYPADLASRPLTLPQGLASLSVTMGVLGSSDSTIAPEWGLSTTAAYGVTRNLELDFSVLQNASGGSITSVYQVARFAAARLMADYVSTSSADESSATGSTAPTTVSTSRRIHVQAGIPLKLKFGAVPISVGAFDSLVDLFVPIATTSIPSPPPPYLRLSTPVYVQFSPLHVLSIQASVRPIFPIGTQVAEILSVASELDIVFTTPHVDFGLAGAMTLLNDLQNGPIPWTYAAMATLTARLGVP